MTRKFWNWVRNEEPDSFGSDRTLYLDGEISDETWFGDEVTPKLFSDEMCIRDSICTYQKGKQPQGGTTMKYTIEAIENAKPGMRWEEIGCQWTLGQAYLCLLYTSRCV